MEERWRGGRGEAAGITMPSSFGRKKRCSVDRNRTVDIFLSKFVRNTISKVWKLKYKLMYVRVFSLRWKTKTRAKEGERRMDGWICPLEHLHWTWARRGEEGNGKGEAVRGKERRRD